MQAVQQRLGAGTLPRCSSGRMFRSAGLCQKQQWQQRSSHLCHNKLGDDLLDFVQAGPKMRKWYGQGERMPQDGGSMEPEKAPGPDPSEVEQSESDGPRDTVLVTDAESAMGEQVVLQLILARSKVRVLVRDVAATRAGFGPYVDPVSVDVGSAAGLARALKGVRCVVALGQLRGLLPACKKAGVQRVVLLSTAGMPQPSGLAALFSGSSPEDAVLKDAQREAELRASGLPHVIVKTSQIKDVPGGASALSFRPSSSGSSTGGAPSSISREDLACVVARVLEQEAGLPGQLVFEVVGAGPGAPPADWGGVLSELALSS